MTTPVTRTEICSVNTVKELVELLARHAVAHETTRQITKDVLDAYATDAGEIVTPYRGELDESIWAQLTAKEGN